MRLESMTYMEFEGEPKHWSLEGLTFSQVNLIVGPNAVGKSRTINIIKNMAWLISGKHKELFANGHFIAGFRDGDSSREYELDIKARHVQREVYKVNGEIMLNRGGGGMGRIYAEDLTEDGKPGMLKFQTPDTYLAVLSRRDSVQHKFLEDIYDWASSIRYFDFGSQLGRESLMVLLKHDQQDSELDDTDPDRVAAVFQDGLKLFKSQFTDSIKADMNAIGYKLDEVFLRRPMRVQLPIPGDVLGIAVKEHDLAEPTDHHEISRGMFRALSIIIHITYARLSKKMDCVLIDDIGEGLDFSRSCALIELLRRRANEDSFQLIMSTNDRFVMNRVPLEEWCFLQRTGPVVHVRNYKNSRETFERFKVTGLSNFDLLTTNFMAEVPLDG